MSILEKQRQSAIFWSMVNGDRDRKRTARLEFAAYLNTRSSEEGEALVKGIINMAKVMHRTDLKQEMKSLLRHRETLRKHEAAKAKREARKDALGGLGLPMPA